MLRDCPDSVLPWGLCVRAVRTVYVHAVALLPSIEERYPHVAEMPTGAGAQVSLKVRPPYIRLPDFLATKEPGRAKEEWEDVGETAVCRADLS